jgi:signal transduction histidine kinase
MVELLVHDSGPGVEEKLRPRIFEKFVVGNHTGRGSGLGLAFCRLAVEAQGGRIRLEHSGPGAVFAFSLPLTRSPAA